jgi:hypothetical protein
MLRGPLGDRGTRLDRPAVFLVLVGLVAAVWWIFHAAGQNYWDFWAEFRPTDRARNRGFWAWGGLDRNPGLVSADPLYYAGTALQVAGVPLLAFGGHMQRANQDRSIPARDTLLVVPLAIVFSVAVISWLVLIASAQYFAFLIAGAPSRIALASR